MNETLDARSFRSFLFSGSLPFVIAIGAAALSCGGDENQGSGTGGAGATGNTAGSGGNTASSASGTGTGTGGRSSGSGTGGGSSSGSGTGSGGGGGSPPDVTCPEPIQAVDTSSPNAVVGSGTPASCTEGALDTALAQGGIVTFDCGASPVTITVTVAKKIAQNTVIDGGGKVTLSGGGASRILHLASAWNQTTPKLTVQHLAFTGGFTTDELNTKDTDQGGAAIFREGGELDVIDCQFTDNHCASTGQDVSGGAITSQGIGKTVIVGSRFSGNSGSNGGAVGNLGNILTVVNSTFDGNAATGTDGNPGNGGNGGAIVFDGAGTTLTLCGLVVTNNTAGAIGGALFRVAYTDEPTTIDRCTFDGNSADATVGLAGAIYLQETTITMTATTLSNNKAHYGGGFWIGQGAIGNLTNVTIANNTSDQGGGFWFANEVTGTFLNLTIAGNQSGYGEALFGNASGVDLRNCIIANNDCKGTPFASGGTNLGFAGGDGCTSGTLTGDPLLGPLQDNGGPTQTMSPAAGSPALAQGMSCPATDQRGQPRQSPCTLGAVEAN